jgi:hypothetical protein
MRVCVCVGGCFVCARLVLLEQVPAKAALTLTLEELDLEAAASLVSRFRV